MAHPRDDEPSLPKVDSYSSVCQVTLCFLPMTDIWVVFIFGLFVNNAPEKKGMAWAWCGHASGTEH